MDDTFTSSAQREWELRCPETITADPIWGLLAYRTALFLLDCARRDLRAGIKRGLYREIAAQLLASVASISANIGEGYSRATRADRLRIFGYGLGSLREAVSWYLAAADFLPPGVADQRLELIAHNRQLLLGLIKSTRSRSNARGFEP